MCYKRCVIRLNDLLLFNCENSFNMRVYRSGDKDYLLQWEYLYHYMAQSTKLRENEILN